MEANAAPGERAGQVSAAAGEQIVVAIQYAGAGLLRGQQVNDRRGLIQHAVPGGGQLAGIRRRALEF